MTLASALQAADLGSAITACRPPAPPLGLPRPKEGPRICISAQCPGGAAVGEGHVLSATVPHSGPLSPDPRGAWVLGAEQAGKKGGRVPSTESQVPNGETKSRRATRGAQGHFWRSEHVANRGEGSWQRRSPGHLLGPALEKRDQRTRTNQRRGLGLNPLLQKVGPLPAWPQPI